jgi:2-dehydro-3-deoxyglucarate aldolase
MKQKKVSIGSWVTLNHFSIVEIMAGAGFDWLCVDMEHSVIDYYEAQKLIATIQAKGLKAFVRVGENNTRIIKRVLDAGADGIIVPMVNSKEDAMKAINSVKYPPIGKRGVGLARAQGYGFDFENYKNNKAENIKLIVQIEHVDAVNNLEDILSLEDIDGTFIGPYDLSGSMGKPGRYNDIDVKAVIKKYEITAKKYNKLIGYHVIEPDYKLVEEKIKSGYNFIAFSLDTLFLGTIARYQLKKINSI